MDQNLFSIALTFFLITNPIGNSPAIAAMIKDFPLSKQRRIMVREGIFSLLLAITFQFFGQQFTDLIQAQPYTFSITGGIIFLFVSLEMIFPPLAPQLQETAIKQEPFFVPIATPLLAGPGLLTVIMFYSKQVGEPLVISGAIILSWIGVMIVLSIAPYLTRLLGPRGMKALEQLMGMILAMISVDMFIAGIRNFTQSLN